MAASMPKTCLCCKTQITDKKSYRCVYEDVGDRFMYILWESGIKGSDYLCKFCLNKLNRITRIDEKIPTINVERRQILEALIKRFSKDHDEGELTTPIKSKRPLAKTTTTPRKTETIKFLYIWFWLSSWRLLGRRLWKSKKSMHGCIQKWTYY